MEDAKLQAQELAEAAGLSLVEIQTINFYDNSPYPYYEGKGGGGGAESAAVPIQPGQLAISVTVSVTYTIK
ncbi:hypothetical protein ANRL2_01822 [Anaerolineae bacterium]|nr:hypothetical protein ANRL2_01822 [Anaerolineae bacterium]